MLAVANLPGRGACGQFLAGGCVLDSKGVAYIILWIRELDNPLQDFGREPPSEVERNSRKSSVADALPPLARCLEERGGKRAHLASSSSIFPAREKPWQGWPPKRQSTGPGSSRRSSSKSTVRRSNRLDTATSALWLWVSQAAWLASAAHSTSKPALVKPTSIPPAPEKSDTAVNVIACEAAAPAALVDALRAFRRLPGAPCSACPLLRVKRRWSNWLRGKAQVGQLASG